LALLGFFCTKATDSMLMKLTPGHVVDDVDAVSRVEHICVVCNLLQDLRRRVTINDDAKN